MEILRRVFTKSVLIVLLSAVLSALLIEPRKVPLGIIMGWIFGLFNLRSLTRNVEGMLGSEKATFRLVLLSLTRLMILFIIIIILIYYRIVNVFGLLFGFTIVFVFILIEGAKVGRSQGHHK